MDENKNLKIEDNIKPGFKDYIAIALAIVETVVPFIIIAIVIITSVLIFITRVWLK
ncbi:MAG: hypothetical protein PHX70_01460 [Clostridium sp.]|nr:hypothetical protein [Clostridium sp.]